MIFERERTPEYWATLKDEPALLPLIEAMKAEYDALSKESHEVLSYAKYKLYFVTGDRREFEIAYFHRRALLVRSMLLYLLYPQKTEYLDTLQDVIWEICNEYSWVVPAHSFSHKIDLFSSETALLLTECMTYLNERLDKTVTERIRDEVRKRVIEVYNKETMSWEYGASNWTAVCTSHLGLTMMYAFEEEFDQNKERMVRSMQAFLGGFSKEGVCYEGPTYWNYGFGCFVWFADALCRYTGGKEDLLGSERAFQIAAYPRYVTLCGGAAVTFSDSSPKLNFGPLLLNYLGEYYRDKYPCIGEEYKKISTQITGSQFSYLTYFLFARLLTRNEKKPITKNDYFLPDAGYVILNREKWSFAVKAGHNAELHNHNDVGSFIFADADGQALCDLGCGFYSADYFGEKRYDILCNSSLSHNVPILDGKGQSAGKEHSGEISFADGRVRIDFGKAYDLKTPVLLMRTVTASEDGVLLTDTCQGENESFVERFVTLRKPEITGETVRLGKTVIRFDGAKIRPEVSTGLHKKHDGTDQTVTFIDFLLPKEERSVTFTIRVGK